MGSPYREIRAVFDEQTIRVYQAYSHAIADAALAAGTFVAPFKMERMTWIKPSFLWMMYRAGWGTKSGQERILGVDVTREGFEWALRHACVSTYHPRMHPSREAWEEALRTSPVRVQWDPERSLKLGALPYRSLQIGLRGEAVRRYVKDWITRIEDVTSLSHRMSSLLRAGRIDEAAALKPIERPYTLPEDIRDRIGAGDVQSSAE